MWLWLVWVKEKHGPHNVSGCISNNFQILQGPKYKLIWNTPLTCQIFFSTGIFQNTRKRDIVGAAGAAGGGVLSTFYVLIVAQFTLDFSSHVTLF